LDEGEGVVGMARFAVDTRRSDPYRNFKFRVTWDGRSVAGMSKIGWAAPAGGRPGGGPLQGAITLERGVTVDAEFERWANAALVGGAGSALPPAETIRKDLVIEVVNEAGERVLAYSVVRAWVSEYRALPDLDANANAVAIEHMKVENEGWERMGEP
jgi:hypothetical protein